jgi:hypothetical protein
MTAGSFRGRSFIPTATSLLVVASAASFYLTSQSLESFIVAQHEAVRLQVAFSGEADAASTIRNDEQDIPEALLPVTFEDCCEPEKENLYPQTCLTEKACNSSSLYPFTSEQEARMFQPWMPTREEDFRHREQCERANAEMAPAHRWCQSQGNNINHTSSFPFGCSRPIGMGGGSGPYDRLYLYPKGKLAFCGIPKVAITQWLHFLRFTLGALDYQSIPYFKNDANAFRFDRLSPKVQKDIWQDSSWTKAIFIREPSERLLSAYLDKVQVDETQPNPPFGYNVTFAQFIDFLSSHDVKPGVNETHGAMTGLTWMSDPHWRPQAWSCGLSEDMAKFDYIGSLDRAAYHSKALLQQTGLWESFGKHYRVTQRGKHKGFHAAVTYPPDPLKPGESALGFQQEAGDDRQAGITTRRSQASWNKLNEYYTPELLEKVKKLYWMDFALWDALQEAQEEGLVRGKDIVTKLNPNCAENTGVSLWR